MFKGLLKVQKWERILESLRTNQNSHKWHTQPLRGSIMDPDHKVKTMVIVEG